MKSLLAYWSSYLKTLGQIFSEERQAKGLSLEELHLALKIQPAYLEAIEADNFSVFPSAPMLRGFIRNYSLYLGLDSASILALYEQHISGSKRWWIRQQQGISFMEMPITKPRSLINPDLVITFLLITALLGSILFFAYTQYLEPVEAGILSTGNPETLPEVNDPAVLTLPTPSSLPTDTPTPIPTSTPQYYTGVTVEMAISERSWVQTLVDDVKVFDDFLDPGEQRRWDGQQRVAIRAGNAGGVEIYVNGDYKGFMGESGQVVDQLWEKVDEPLPAPTPTPSP
jgi:cytoskeletal protein RodZ